MSPDLLIAAAEVLARVPMAAAIGAVEAAFVALRAGRIDAPVSAGVRVADGTFHVKACAGMGAAGAGLFVAKVNSNFPGNRSCGLPTIQGVIAVFETANGRLRALVDSPSVTALRTAATTAVAVRHLAPDGAREAALVGCGALGPFNLEALAACGVERVSLFDSDPSRANALAAHGAGLGLRLRVAAGVREATLGAPIVLTCTTSSEPLLGPGDVAPGTFVAAVGADNEHKAEIAPELLARARMVADLAAQCVKTGDLRNAGAGIPVSELADAVAGRVARTGSGEVVVFDSTGLALEDLAICGLLLGSRAGAATAAPGTTVTPRT